MLKGRNKFQADDTTVGGGSWVKSIYKLTQDEGGEGRVKG